MCLANFSMVMTAKVEEVPMSLKAWIDASQGNLRRESMGAKCMVRHFFAI